MEGVGGVGGLRVVCFELLEGYGRRDLEEKINEGYLGVDFLFILWGLVVGYGYDDGWKRMGIGEFVKGGFIGLDGMVIMGGDGLVEKYRLRKWEEYWKEEVGKWYGMLLDESEYVEGVMGEMEGMVEGEKREEVERG